MKQESKLFIDYVYLSMIKNKIFALSVHDGLYVKKSDQKKSLDHIQKEIGRGIAKMFKLSDAPVIRPEHTRSDMLTDWDAILDPQT